MKNGSLHKRLPASCFYWALLDPRSAGLPAHPSSEQLGYLFEAVLPCTIEEIQPAYAGTSDRRFVACGMLREALAEQCVGAETFTPEELPPFIEAPVDLRDLNLLVGDFEPPAIRQMRLRWLVHAALLLLACSLLLALGMEFRARELRQQTAAINDARADIHEQVLGPVRTTGQPPELRMLAELRQLRQTRARPAQGDALEVPDVSIHLATLLSHWPVETEEVFLQTEHVSITPGVMTMRGALPSSTEAQRLAERFSAIDGWQLQQPQITSSRDNVQASLRFTAKEEAKP